MGLPKLLGYSVQNTLLRRCVCYAVNRKIVVIGKEYASPFYLATDSGLTWPPRGRGYHVGDRSGLVETGAFPQTVGSRLHKLHSESEQSVENG